MSNNHIISNNFSLNSFIVKDSNVNLYSFDGKLNAKDEYQFDYLTFSFVTELKRLNVRAYIVSESEFNALSCDDKDDVLIVKSERDNSMFVNGKFEYYNDSSSNKKIEKLVTSITESVKQFCK